MWKSTKNIKETIILFNNYLKEYGQGYSKQEIDFIKKYFYKNIGEHVAPVDVLQIYSELGIWSKEDDLYQAHLDNIKSLFDIRCDVLEVASGNMPAFANLLAHEQLELGMGTITIYEPDLAISTSKYSNMRLHRDYFSSKIDISGFDLVTAIMPCHVTEDVLKAACMNKKNFYVSLCGCNHLFDYGFGQLYDPSYYHECIIEQTKELLDEYDNGELVIDYLDSKYEMSFPILYNKKK